MKKLLWILPLLLSSPALGADLFQKETYECRLGGKSRGTVTLSYSRLGIWVSGKNIRIGAWPLADFSREIRADELPGAGTDGGATGPITADPRFASFFHDEKFRENFGQYGLEFSVDQGRGSVNFRLNAEADGVRGVWLPARRQQRLDGAATFVPANWRESEDVLSELRCRYAGATSGDSAEIRAYVARLKAELTDLGRQAAALRARFYEGTGFASAAALPEHAGVYGSRCLRRLGAGWESLTRAFGTAFRPDSDVSFAFVNIAGTGEAYAPMMYPGIRGRELVSVMSEYMKPYAPPYVASRLGNGTLRSDYRDFEKEGAPHYLVADTRPLTDGLGLYVRDPKAEEELLCVGDTVEVAGPDLPENLR